jgi:hypothetical protein
MEEVSNNSSNNIELSEQARSVISQLITLHAVHFGEKAVLFEQLYQLWSTDGLVILSSRLIENKFEQNRGFIKETILNTFYTIEEKEKIKNVELIYNTLRFGQAYTTKQDKIIYPNQKEKDKYRNQCYYNNRIIKTHFSSLLSEFQHFMNHKNESLKPPFIIEPLDTTPDPLDQDQAVTRVIPERDSSAAQKVPDYFTGMTSDTSGSKRKRGKKDDKDSETNEVSKELYLLLHYYLKLIFVYISG